MINAEWYNNQTDNTKFIPVLRGEDRTASTPIFVNAFINLDMRNDTQWGENIEALLRTIYNQPKIVKPTIGKRPDFLAMSMLIFKRYTNKVRQNYMKSRFY